MSNKEPHHNPFLCKHLHERLNLVGRTSVDDEDDLVVEVAIIRLRRALFFSTFLRKTSFTHLEKMLPVMKLFSVLKTLSSFSE